MDIFKTTREAPKQPRKERNVERQPILLQTIDATAIVGTDLTRDSSWTVQELKKDYEFLMNHERLNWVDHELLHSSKTAAAAGTNELILEKQMGIVLNELVTTFQAKTKDPSFATREILDMLAIAFHNTKPLADAAAQQALDYAGSLCFSWSKSQQAKDFLSAVAGYCFQLWAMQRHHGLALQTLEHPNDSNNSLCWQADTRSESLVAPCSLYPALLQVPVAGLGAELCSTYPKEESKRLGQRQKVLVAGLFLT